MKNPKVALVYDRVNKWGGAERVLLALHEIFPKAPLFTAVYHPQKAPWAGVFKVKPSFLQKFPFAKSHHQLYPWLTPLAFESFDFSGFNLVISVTSAEAKGIITGPKTFHLCYCLTPTRYLWSGRADYQRSPGFGKADFLAKIAWRLFLPYLTKWDQVASQRPDAYLSISKTIQKRVKKYYRRDSEVIYPPVDLGQFRLSTNSRQPSTKKFFLIVSRLVPYKRIDLAIKAFNKSRLPLKIAGLGTEMTRLKKMAGPTIEFLGKLTEKELLVYYYSCQAVICPQEEDFGLVPLEAQACGKPVISFKKGGALETILKGRTGEFFYPQTAKALFNLVRSFRPKKYCPKKCRENAADFGKALFIKRFKKKVRSIWQKSPKKA
jgi:glycosyltransferase involved in cell wall biosynthesis